MALDAETRRSRRTWQRVASWVLVVLTAIAVTGTVIGFWVHRTVLDTNAFMASVTPIVESESVRAVVSDRIGDELVEALDLDARLSDRLSQADARLRERLAEALDLPDAVVRRLQNAELGLESLAPVIAAGVESRIRGAVETFLSSPEGNRLLLQTIELAHERSVLLLRDDLEQLPNVVVTEGEVRLNLVPVLAEVLRSLVNSGLDIIGIEREIPPFDSSEDASAAVERLAGVLGRDLPADFGQVRIASEASLENAQGLVRAFDVALWVLAITAILLAALAIWLAPSTSAGVIRVGIAATIAAIVGWLLVQLLSAQLVEAAATADGRAAVGDIVRALVNGLSGTAFALAVIGIGLVAAGFVANRPSRVAVVEGSGSVRPPTPPPATEAVVEGTSSSPAPRPRRRTPKPAAAKAPAPSTTKKRRRPPAAGA